MFADACAPNDPNERNGNMITSAPPIPRYDVRERFQQLAAKWKKQSRHMSNTAQMAMLPSYQQIIGIGEPAVPLLLEELRREPDHWFWALEAITQESPVPSDAAGKVRLMAQAWVDWGIRQGYIEHEDPDHVAGGVYGEVMQIMKKAM
jgi:hypothetical protein